MTIRMIVALVSLLISTGVSAAGTMQIASYGSVNTSPAGALNTGLIYNGADATYDIGTGGVWADPIAGTSWVSFNPNTYPGGSVQPVDGTYAYTTTFADTATSTGTIAIMADDTASVYLNGFPVVAAAGPATAGTCTTGTPNCTAPATFLLPSADFVNGTNTLTFDVDQRYGYAEGIDFSADISTAVTPEPPSLLLLVTGLLGVAAMTLSRAKGQRNIN